MILTTTDKNRFPQNDYQSLHKKILIATKNSSQPYYYKFVLNITYHPNFSNLKDTMSLLHFLLTPDKEHQVFHKVSITGFRKAESLKDIERYSSKNQCLHIKHALNNLQGHILPYFYLNYFTLFI